MLLKASLGMKLRGGPWCRKGKGYVVGAGDHSHDHLVCSSSHYRNVEEMRKFESRSLWLILWLFWLTFVLLSFYSLQSIYVLNLKLMALAIREIYTVAHKLKPVSSNLGHVFFSRRQWQQSCQRLYILPVIFLFFFFNHPQLMWPNCQLLPGNKYTGA